MYLKVFAYTCITVYGIFKLNQVMQRRLDRRQARLDGRLDEFLVAEEQEREKTWRRKLLGKMGHSEIDGGIKNTSIGGEWSLVDLDNREFSSNNLRGHYYLLFFGSSLCPDTCPFTLMKMMKVHRQIERQSEGK
jgi:hypothetical protein